MTKKRRNGEITKDDYVKICKHYRYGGDEPERYYLKVKENVYLYLQCGFKND